MAELAGSQLRELGYTNVTHFAGGITGWERSGGPLAVGDEPGAVPVSESRTSLAPPPPKRSRVAVPWLLRLADLPVRALLSLWIGMVLGCAALYWGLGALGPELQEQGTYLNLSLHSLLTAVYFSFVTATSVGFGDVTPLGVARLVAIGEAAAGLLIFGCLVSKFVSRRQEELLEETHRIAFEDRLGRVRTNLHLVFSEVQAIAAACADGSCPPARRLARMESATMVLNGELRAVHDLLYRPQQEPEEAALEAILATLAGVLGEIGDLAESADGAGLVPSRLLERQFDQLQVLAGEICGDCVPREYAPALKEWMDRVQEHSRRVRRSSPPPR